MRDQQQERHEKAGDVKKKGRKKEGKNKGATRKQTRAHYSSKSDQPQEGATSERARAHWNTTHERVHELVFFG